MTGPRPTGRMLLAVAVGGAAGALLRWSLGEAVPDGRGFPWTTLGINVVGSLLLAVLPAIVPPRRRPLLTAALGPGLLGGFTTLSTYAEQARALVAEGDLAAAGAYVIGTLGACLVAVLLGGRLAARRDHDDNGDGGVVA